MANVQLGENPTQKENAIYWLKVLIELIENDKIKSDEIAGIFAGIDPAADPEAYKAALSKVVALAEAEADRAIENAGKLAEGN